MTFGSVFSFLTSLRQKWKTKAVSVFISWTQKTKIESVLVFHFCISILRGDDSKLWIEWGKKHIFVHNIVVKWCVSCNVKQNKSEIGIFFSNSLVSVAINCISWHICQNTTQKRGQIWIFQKWAGKQYS